MVDVLQHTHKVGLRANITVYQQALQYLYQFLVQQGKLHAYWLPELSLIAQKSV